MLSGYAVDAQALQIGEPFQQAVVQQVETLVTDRLFALPQVRQMVFAPAKIPQITLADGEALWLRVAVESATPGGMSLPCARAIQCVRGPAAPNADSSR